MGLEVHKTHLKWSLVTTSFKTTTKPTFLPVDILCLQGYEFKAN